MAGTAAKLADGTHAQSMQRRGRVSKEGVPNAMVGDDFQYSLGPPNSGFSLFLAERTKKIHFIRHAEGYHNVETKKMGTNTCLHRGDVEAQEHRLWDARLTEVGIQQAQNLRAHLAQRPSGGRSFTAFDLVVVSPLTRTLETAQHIFGRGRQPGVPAFLDPGMTPEGSEEAARGERVPAPRVLVREECRERWGEYVCDGRRKISEIMPEFPTFDFSELSYDEDVFYSDKRESDAHCCERGISFLEWLNKRPEKCIAVVTHSSFLRHIFSQFGGNQHHDDMESLQRLAGNCELRSIVMCSHGNKDGKEIRPMTTDGPPPSTVMLETVHEATVNIK
mmetsp:Transcript_43447/g.114169  ORF Transcript_43447/g.114169 Transcript_43447/m.114169 type:complete len:334 (+) Transcript_43447:54-1055(+)|eukprot:CAMPEP_0115847326 /NCGR_PEP_ID=MMETSP0287-20121206/10324_1 /TAXON_ID=412157 /ORGANISM="Chrysochromulina rotalis, Strain UIO044" /LENGTH=333 /DNA_ID=CAMNT_0003301155 /DNA_START=51 /DNA_END=1052 /DNA_ORIENTATION=+